jgi:hypothetical protein
MDAVETIDSILRTKDCPELIIGLVGPIGADLKHVADVIERKLATVGYRSYQLRVTTFLRNLKLEHPLVEEPLEQRYRSYIAAGNALCEKMQRKDAFALLSIAAIRRQRIQINYLSTTLRRVDGYGEPARVNKEGT